MKYLRVTMPDGSKWDVPASIVAENRALHYSDGVKDGDYDEEYETAMAHEYTIKDWAANNMNWSDVQDEARKVSEPNLGDFQEGWMNGEKEIVEY
jgi:hypothetical protein